MAFRPKNGNFAPDVRYSGWWITSIVEFIDAGSGKGFVSNKNAQATMESNLRDLFGVYGRFRVYLNDTLLMISAREEDVDHISDALHSFRLERPKPEQYLNAKIVKERLPYYLDFVDELSNLIHDHDIEKVLSSTVETAVDRVKQNLVSDRFNVIVKRILAHELSQKHFDILIKGLFREMLVNPSKCNGMSCTWTAYKNIVYLQDKLESMGTRSKEEKDEVFRNLIPLTKNQLDILISKNLEDVVRNIDKDITEHDKEVTKKEKEVEPPIQLDKSENEPNRNEDIERGRALFLSTSTTYAIDVSVAAKDLKNEDLESPNGDDMKETPEKEKIGSQAPNDNNEQ